MPIETLIQFNNRLGLQGLSWFDADQVHFATATELLWGQAQISRELAPEKLPSLRRVSAVLRSFRFDGEATETGTTFFAKLTPMTFDSLMYGLLRRRFG